MATICCVLPTATDGVEGDTVTVVKVGPIKKSLHPLIASTQAANATSRMSFNAPRRLKRIAFHFIVAILNA